MLSFSLFRQTNKIYYWSRTVKNGNITSIDHCLLLKHPSAGVVSRNTGLWILTSVVIIRRTVECNQTDSVSR